MKIGVLSDTHLKEPGDVFERIIEAHFAKVDKILHAGDFVEKSVAAYLSKRKELIAVYGNMDPPDVRAIFPRTQVIQLGQFRIGLIHGGGSPVGIESRIRAEFENVDAIVYGHTHMPANHRAQHILFFNPGSLTRPFHQGPTLGLLHVGEKLEGEIIKI